MSKVMPQEIEVWYLLPGLRRELVTMLVRECSLTQREAAERMGLTEAAISQYINAKRGMGIEFSVAEKERIRRAAKRLAQGEQEAMETLYTLCASLRGSRTLCELHRRYDPNVPHNCKLCAKAAKKHKS